MNTVSISPEVLDFAATVRGQLADLSPDEREELAGGLEADLSDLVAERGTVALGDPLEYARELRAAAGLPAQGRVRPRQALPQRVDDLLDRAHARWDRSATGLPGGPWEFLVSLQPAWWVLRAYVACQTVDIVLGDGGWNMRWVPSLMGWGLPVLAVAVVVSVQIGRRRWWPGRPARIGERLLLLALNLLAIAMVPVVFDSLPNVSNQDIYSGEEYWPGSDGLVNRGGTTVTNVFPYDAEGRPLVGVQLFDQYGDPLAVAPGVPNDVGKVRWSYPWTNVNGRVWNTFPMPEAPDTGGWRRMESPWTSTTPPQLPRPPHESVPTVSTPAAGSTPAVEEGQQEQKGERRERRTGRRG